MIRIALSHVLFAAAVVALAYTAARAEPSQQVIRDASGRTTGTATTDSQGTTTFRDSRGSTTGTASPSFGGSAGNTTTFRDAGGRTTGTVTTPWRR